MRLTVLFLFFSLLLRGQLTADVVLTTGHSDQVNAMAITPNGKFLASASTDKQLKIWDLAKGMEFRTIAGTDGRIEQLTFSPDNKTLAGTTFNEELIVWDVVSGKEMYKGTAETARGLGFSSDGNMLYYINDDAAISKLNLSTLTTQVVLDFYTTDFVFDKDRQLIYALDHLGNVSKINATNGAVIYTKKLFDEYMYPYSNSDITVDGKFIAYGFSDDRLRIFNTETGTFQFESKKYDSKIVCLTFDRESPIVYTSLHSGDFVIFDYNTEKIVGRQKIDATPYSAQCMTAHPAGEIVVVANMSLITLFDFKRKRVFKQLGQKVNRIYNMAYDPTGKYLAVATDKLQLKIWDLTLNKVVDSIQAFFPCEFTPDGKSIIAMTYQINLGLFDVETGEQKKTFNTDSELIQSISISEDGKKLAGAGYQNIVKVWDLESSMKIKDLPGHTGGILALDFHPTKPWIVSGSFDETARVWNYETGKQEVVFKDQTVCIHDVKFSPTGNQLATAAWDKTIYLRNTSDWSVQHLLNGHVNSVNTIDFNSDGTVLVSGASNNTVSAADNSTICWDTKSGAILCQLKKHRGEVLKVICDPLKPRFYSASVDGAVMYSDYSTCELIATYHSIGSSEFMIYTPDNYYIASRNAIQGIAFRIGDKLVPFEQYDIHLNRPDIVADRIGKSSAQLIKAYYYLYKKRLGKLNLDEGNLKIDFNLPNVLNETKYDIVTTASSQKLWISAWDDNYNLKRIDVFVNNVPVFGEKGLEIPAKTKSIRKEIEIPLVNGENHILISCMNSNGVESLYENIEIIRNSDPEKHDLYIAAIGVSDYLDPRFNLKYPKKDATDMISKFGESGATFRQVYSTLLTNEEVTIENITALSAFFEKCTHEDMAIVFIAGHGVLNVDYDYYFGTYDMDFNAPERRGLSYSKITSLLTQIKAYQKLLIMDTCHSGELDKEEIEMAPDPELEEGGVQFRSGGANIRTKEGIGTENLSKVTEYVFSDMRRGSGATVISSAGGAEYAMESDEWRNGLFTYVFLKGLIASQGNPVYLSEIRAYVNLMVKELSHGKQIPTAREENISRDYIIFGE